ncbi:MAG: hypothetical protein AAB214_09340 [Fibrobacterota bacterium]
MIKLDDAPWGLRIEMQGQPTRQELSKLLDDLRKALPSARPFFGVILDMSGTGLINPEVRDLLVQAQKLLQSKGMIRMAASLTSGLATSQFRRISSETGVGPGLRCLDSKATGWQMVAERWAVSGHEPESAIANPASTGG